ncbi:NAD-dependent epimerase/dehydratase family protein [Nocardioides sp. BP30]|uniref:NAD-dependent epimerase/dehydratase family protein n=1 Tax=Nocardioides sp. BP30 TaxID=3036374 RepID=UPI0024683D5D|nr:NAD-dependent epimerase/dehydratase family protein [Nocardioides sp. BP30]WGL51361.1 NAD-dependent epimerase/dehydratase family protein [Nocardioides sp. BP30]
MTTQHDEFHTGRRVLVTGGNGYLGSWLTARLLQSGERVRVTLRSPDREAGLRSALARAGADDGDLEIALASLTSADGWAAAVAGCDVVHHVATPMIQPTDPAEVVVPARDGALHVLRAAREAGVRRVVLTSSFAAVGYTPKPVRDYTEDDWTDPETPGLPAYPMAKTVAERAAWDFVEQYADAPELVSLNPTFILGPALTAEARSSLQLVQGLASGHLTTVPKQRFGLVDVRDVAAAHVAAMDVSEAAGRRYLLLADGPSLTYREVARLVHEAASTSATVTEAPGEEPTALTIHNDRAKAELAFRPRPVGETIAETVASLRELGLIG